jgi:hypothetical protein
MTINLTMLTLILAILKIANVLNISWLLVFAPILLPVAVITIFLTSLFIIIISVMICAIIADVLGKI